MIKNDFFCMPFFQVAIIRLFSLRKKIFLLFLFNNLVGNFNHPMQFVFLFNNNIFLASLIYLKYCVFLQNGKENDTNFAL